MTLSDVEANLLNLYGYEARYIGVEHITCCQIGAEGVHLYINLMRADSLDRWLEILRTAATAVIIHPNRGVFASGAVD